MHSGKLLIREPPRILFRGGAYITNQSGEYPPWDISPDGKRFVMIKRSPSKGNVAAPTGLPVKWEELTAPNFIKAVELAGGTCIIPLGVVEKHGPHLPLRTDLIEVRAMVLRAAQKEYSIIFPNHYAVEGKYGSREIGGKELNREAEQLNKVIREVKAEKR
jgi:hypothetical protein